MQTEPAREPGTGPGAIEVRGFRLTGLAEAYREQALAFLAPWTRRTLTARELGQAAEELAAWLRLRDLPIAQTVVPPQQVRDGVVEIAVLEGTLGALRLDQDEPPRVRSSTVQAILADLVPGVRLDGATLERRLLLANDLPGIRVDAAIAPTARPGVFDVNAKVVDDGTPLSASAVLDNAGFRDVGEYRADVALQWRSPLRFGDLLVARVLATHTGGQRLASLTYGAPINRHGTRLGLRMTEQEYRIGGAFAALRAHGRQNAVSLMASHPLLRRVSRNVLVSAAWTEWRTSDRQDAVGFEYDARQRVLTLGMNAELHDDAFGGGRSLVHVLLHSGQNALATPLQSALDAGPGGLRVAGHYTVARLRLEREQRVGRSNWLKGTLVAQGASRNLDAGTELRVGGPDAVRAYQRGEAFADTGRLLQLEAGRRVALFDAHPTNLFVFLDHARVAINRNPLAGDATNKRSFEGIGFGLGQDFGRSVTLGLSAAWRLSAASASEPDRRPRVWVSVGAHL